MSQKCLPRIGNGRGARDGVDLGPNPEDLRAGASPPDGASAKDGSGGKANKTGGGGDGDGTGGARVCAGRGVLASKLPQNMA